MRHARLSRLASLIVVLVVAALPGTTSASTASAQPPSPGPVTDPDAPILIDARLYDLLARQDFGEAIDPNAPPASFFERAQVVSIYGHPDTCGMGELGCHDTAGAIATVQDLARQYDAVNGDRDVVAALHLIVDVAQATKQRDGTYLDRMDLDRVGEYVEVARENGLLLFLDLQVGWSDLFDDVQRLRPALQEPFVHLAIDPEFATEARRAAPGEVIGAIGADDLNEVQHYLAGLVQAKHLPPKILVVHQFLPSMIEDTEDLDSVPEVELTIDMDGYGPPGPKESGFAAYARSDYSERAAFKLFFHWDEPLLTPAEVMAIPDPPDYVIYQ